MYNFDKDTKRKGTNCYKWDVTDDREVIPMWVADMDFQTAPAIIEALKNRVEHGVFGYTKVPDEYYNAITNWFDRRHGWKIEKDWILYTTGVVPAVSVAIKAMTEPGDGVILHTPAYNCFFSSIRNNGCKVVESPLLNDDGHFSIDYKQLETLCSDKSNKVLLLCNPHNPTGRLWTREELQRVYDICHKHKVSIIADEIHCELTYNGERYVPFGTITDDAVILGSPSKAFNIAGLQIANIICKDESMRMRIDKAININEVCDVNPFGVLALMAAYNEGEQWLDELCQYIWGNYQALCRFMAENLPQVKITPLQSTYLVWADCSYLGIKSEELANKLENEGKVKFSPGTMYGDTGEGFLRINIACPRERMMEGLRRMADMFNKIK
ncbi:MAG: pyridoxal phosphate-dependent aminotransferase [Prevotella sp.]|nr:pyridoxal phosphate-dependent aminotransferase [Prevotella sp.]